VVGFDEAVDLSKLTPEERRAAIEKEREALQSTFGLSKDDWKKAEKMGDEDLWTGEKPHDPYGGGWSF